MKVWFFRSLFLIFFALPACGNVNPIPTPTGILYVLDHFNKAVYVFSDINNLNGAVSPVRTITGEDTLIEDPSSLAIDPRRDILYVADSDADAILAFIPGSENDGNIRPRRTYPGIDRTGPMFYDIIFDNLYVVEFTSNTILVWDQISDKPDGSTPDRQIPLGYVPSTLFVDTRETDLYVGDPETNAVQVYVNVTRLDTLEPPPINRTIEEATPSPTPQPFDQLDGLTMNTENDILYVAEANDPSINIFDQASTLDGVVEPDRVLFGSQTAMTMDLGQIHFQENVLYVVLSRTNVGIWDSANTVDGDLAPTRNLQITPATEIVSIAVDLNH